MARLERARVGVAPAPTMGLTQLFPRVAETIRALHRVAQIATERGVRTALLINWTEAAAHLGPRLRAQGIFVVQVVAPQVFAWRPGRLQTFGKNVDALAVLFRFEEPLWRRAGVDATFVGHPAAGRIPPPRVNRPTSDSGTLVGKRVALLPGSRASEVRRLLPPMLAAARRLRADGVDCELLPAGGLDPATRRWLDSLAKEAGFVVRAASGDDLINRLAHFDAALSASGTATLECALAEVPPVIAYRVDAATELAFRRLAHREQIGLPNLLLNRLVFPECLQERADGPTLAEATRGILRHPPRVRDELHREVSPPGDASFGARVVSLLSPRPSPRP
jgi:lipid-A-disaccharide synthase